MSYEETFPPSEWEIVKGFDNRRFEIALENSGKLVGYNLLPGLQVYAYDVRGGALPDLMRLGLRRPEKGRFLRSSVCRSGKCEFIKHDRSALMNANEGVAEYRINDYPLSIAAEHYLGLESILFPDKMPQENSFFQVLRKELFHRIPEVDSGADSLYYFNMSTETKHTVDALLQLCFTGADPLHIIIKAADLGYNYLTDLSSVKSASRSFVNKSQMLIAKEIHSALTDNYGDKWTVGFFAEKYGFSATTIKKYFQSVYGYDIKEYQIKVRMDRAAEMLRETTLSVGDISQRVGYSTHAKFGAKFKDTFGVTPLEYRRRARVARARQEEPDDGSL